MKFTQWLSSSVWGNEPQTARLLQLRAELAGNVDPALQSESEALNKALSGSERDGTLPDWQTLLQAEIGIIRKLKPEALRLKHASLKQEYAIVASAAQAASYLARLSDPAACGEEQTRAEVIDILSHVHRLRTLRHGFNLIRTSVTLIATILAMLLSLLIALYFMRAADDAPTWTPFATSMLVMSGMLGGCVSALARLHSVEWSEELVGGAENLSHLFWSLVLNLAMSIIVGGIFAGLLYLAFMGNLVSGSLFPSFDGEPARTAGRFPQFVEAGTRDHTDYAKAIVWGFLAGFSERLVPDFLTNLSSGLRNRK